MNIPRPRSWQSILIFLPLFTFACAATTDPYVDGYDLALTGDYRTAYAVWMPLAMKGDGRAQFNLGLMFHSGLYVDLNEETAVYWYRAAAENGITEAQEYMYVAYKEGWFGLPQDEGQAAYWASRLANNQHNPIAPAASNTDRALHRTKLSADAR